jgi:transcriptional regulator with XRE-family HTH domain
MESARVGRDDPPMAKRRFKRIFIREWRKTRRLTLEQLSDLLQQRGQHDVGPSQLSMLERGKRGYTQQTLEAIADALRTDVASLLSVNPADGDPIWALWEQAKPNERAIILEVARAVLKLANKLKL